MEVIEELKEKTKEEVAETPAADFLMGVLLMALSVVICYAAWSWPRPEGIASAPGALSVLHRLYAVFHGPEHFY